MSRYSILLIALIGAAWSQTAVRPEQLRAQAAAVPRLYAVDAAGRVTMLEAGAGITIAGGKIYAAPVAVDISQSVEVLKSDGAGAFVARPGAAYSRNGLQLVEGLDYQLANNGATFKPLVPWTDDDLFAARLVRATVRTFPATVVVAAVAAGAP